MPAARTAEPPPADHVVHLYDDDEHHYYDRLIEYLEAALRRGEAAIAIVTPAHARGILSRLEARGVDVGKMVADQQLQILDADEAKRAIVPDAIPIPTRFTELVGARIDAALARWPRVAALGEIVDLLAAEGRVEALLQLEAIWNRFLLGRPVSLWCAYQLRTFGHSGASDAFVDMCKTHGDVHPVPVAADDGHDERMLLARLQQQTAALRTEIDERRRLEQRKDEFLATLGHELRNPLAAIMTAVEVVRMRGPTRSDNEHAVIERQTRTLARLVDDLLDISRITRGELPLRAHESDIATIISRAIESTSALIRSHGHTVLVEVDPELPSLIVDADRMAQVIANLVANAARYTPRGGRIRLAATRRAGDVEIAVSDNGQGIAPELLPHLFDAFVQGPQAGGRPRAGLGVGLTLAQRLTELHGGTVVAESAGVNQGSTFRVRLPIALAPPAAAAASPPSSLDAVRPIRVLVVDDNVDTAEMVCAALRRLGHDVAVAHDGPRAIDRALAFVPDVVLLDVGLPEMDGLEVARKLRGSGSRARLVALTGYGKPSDHEASRAAGFDSHLVKPVDLATLQQALSQR
jgi:signal transduction histidine kinase